MNLENEPWARELSAKHEQCRTHAELLLRLDWESIRKMGDRDGSRLSDRYGREIAVLEEFCKRIKSVILRFCDVSLLEGVERRLGKIYAAAKPVSELTSVTWGPHLQPVVSVLGKTLTDEVSELVGILRGRPEMFDPTAAVVDSIEALTGEIDWLKTSQTARLAAYEESLSKARSAMADALSAFHAKAKTEELALVRLREEMETTLAVAKLASVGTAISEQSKHFAALVEEYECAATKSFAAIVVLSLSVLCWAGFLHVGRTVSAQASTSALIADRLPDAVIISLLVTLLTVAIRSYLAAKHNHVTNKLRVTAVNTFGAFWNAPVDQAMKDAVLLRACSCVFDHQPTGFSKAAESGGDSSRIIEISRQFNPTAKPTAD